ncbi:MAG: metalloprotease TldD [Alphaproteobacteria bacterium]
MSATSVTLAHDLFFGQQSWERANVEKLVTNSLAGAEDGELFLEYHSSESMLWDDGCLKSAAFDQRQGFGLRGVHGEGWIYAHGGVLDMTSLQKAADIVRAGKNSPIQQKISSPATAIIPRYESLNPLEGITTGAKIALLQEIDAYIRGKDERVVQASINIAGSWQVVEIIKADGQTQADIRPLVRLNISVVVEQGGRRETGSYGGGGRVHYQGFFEAQQWQQMANEAIRQALVNLEAKEAPAGEMVVVLGSGWPGVMLHEAVGHGLEGDFNRKKTSVFTGMVGQQVAATGVSVVDCGTLANRRGSITIDDEGTASGETMLIENGILKGYLQDRLNARLMGVAPTGNGRRQSYAHAPMPRMTNTYMLGGDKTPEEIIASVKKGVYAANFGGGQVDITSGKYVFSATEAYLIENGRVTTPIKGATLIGNGPQDMKKITMVGNNMQLDTGVGTCGKNGQSVPVGVGQPTLRMDGITVGGTRT